MPKLYSDFDSVLKHDLATYMLPIRIREKISDINLSQYFNNELYDLINFD